MAGRFFNTAGPCDPLKHYILPPSERLPEARQLIEQEAYFVVHAPRQTGKTTTLRAIAEELTLEGGRAALHVSCEECEVAQDDFMMAQRILADAIARAAELDLPVEWRPPRPWPSGPPETLLAHSLRAWAEACPRPLSLLLDEIDALRGQSLIAVLRQLRSGFPTRPGHFPASVVLCGLRDVRDYKVASGGGAERLGSSSPFNIKLESLRLGDFSEQDLCALYLQHSAATGQAFSESALAQAFAVTRGQPWLVNALAREIVAKMAIPASESITAEHVDEAKERLILARATHLDSLAARLQEPRVRRVVGALLEGKPDVASPSYDDDALYVRDLGLVAPAAPLRIANPIYQEVITRVLSEVAEDVVTHDPKTFVRAADGRLDFPKLLAEFAEFWKEHGELLAAGMPYREVAPQLVLMAFLQRVVNGGGYVAREYGVGRGRIDLLVRWPYTEGGQRRWQRHALELKMWRTGQPDPLDKGLVQLERYLQQLSLSEGVLVVFDRRADAAPVAQRTRFTQVRTPTHRFAVTVLRA